MTFVGIPARKIQSDYKKDVELFEAYGISKGKIDDPNKKKYKCSIQRNSYSKWKDIRTSKFYTKSKKFFWVSIKTERKKEKKS